MDLSRYPAGFVWLLNYEYVEQKTFRSGQRRNLREIILECLSEGRGCRRR